MGSQSPAAGGHQQISRSEASTWTVQAGADGTWIDVSTPTSDQEKAEEHLAWRNSVAQPSVTFRLVRDTTVHTRTVEPV